MRLGYASGMTRKLSISLPDEAAAVLDGKENASAYIAELIVRDDRTRRTREMFRRHGYVGDKEITDAGIARMRDRLGALEERRRAKRAGAAQGQ